MEGSAQVLKRQNGPRKSREEVPGEKKRSSNSSGRVEGKREAAAHKLPNVDLPMPSSCGNKSSQRT